MHTALALNRVPVQDACDNGLLAGAVTLVWQRGQVLQLNEIGYRDVDAGLPMRRDTIFRIASMTKPVTVAAALSLIDDGPLRLDDPITTWAPEFSGVRVLVSSSGSLDQTVPAQRPITVEDLMTHRCGLAYAFTATGPISKAYRRLPFGQGADVWLDGLGKLPLLHQPGDRVTYGHGTDVLGVVISRVAGKPLGEVLRERILEPLGMTDTGFHISSATRARAATMYQIGDDGSLNDNAMGPMPVTEPTFPNGGGGLLSTADDYLRFARMLLGGGQIDGVRVLSERSVRLMRTDHLTDEQRQHQFLGAPFWVGRGFGLNLSVVTDPRKSRPLFGPGGLGAFGWPGAYGTWWQADPENDLILLYLVQNYPSFTDDAAAVVAGNTSVAKLRTAQPKFVSRTYEALGL